MGSRFFHQQTSRFNLNKRAAAGAALAFITAANGNGHSPSASIAASSRAMVNLEL